MQRRRPSKFTLIKVAKAGIALAPPAIFVYDGWKNGGAPNAANSLVRAYTGYDFATKKFSLEDAAVGYVPLLGAYAFGKIASRVIRF